MDRLCYYFVFVFYLVKIGGVLASPETEQLLSAMTAAMRTSSPPPRVYTGIHDTYAKGSFHSLQGTPLEKIPTKLRPEHSDDDRAEACLVMHQDGTLAKNNCSDSLPYICYKREPTCGSKYNGYVYNRQTGSCYKVYKEKISWRRAFAACAAEDAHLAVVNSQTEATVLEAFFPERSTSINIGFVDWKNHGLWMTVDSKTIKEAGYDTWGAGEPNNYKGQNCGGLLYNGTLDDVSCDGQEFPYVCEKAPDMNQREQIIKHLEQCPRNRKPLCIAC